MRTLEIAKASGMLLRQRGSRWWALCPFHNERTPSFCIFSDDHWYCFGCGKHGDAADLYAAVHKVTIGEALRAVNGEVWKPKPRTFTVNDLRTIIEDWYCEHWHSACVKRHSAQTKLDSLDGMDCAEFWQALEHKAHADDELNALESATPKQKAEWILSERKSKE
jgi:hypothetical protein